jgi:hypothetical protein
MTSQHDYDHAARIFTSDEMLTAYLAERLDRLADRMVYKGHTRLAIYGSIDHITWLRDAIAGMSAFPITALIAGPDNELKGLDEREHRGLPLIAIDHPRLMDFADTVLIADDKYEEDMYRKAMRWLQPGIMVHRLYERLGIGRESLLRATIDRRPKAPRIVVKANGEIMNEAATA